MQDYQDADAQIANELVPPASCATPPKKRGRLVTFFAKMYSPHGTLTCKEFVWPAVYLLTLGKIFLALFLAPVDFANLIFPLKDLELLYRVCLAFYMLFTLIMLFLYPLFNICMKVLSVAIPQKKYIMVALIASIAAIEIHPIFLDKSTLTYYILPYSLYIFLIIICVILRKFIKYQCEDTPD